MARRPRYPPLIVYLNGRRVGLEILEAVLAGLPADFPKEISEPIAKGFERRLQQIQRYLNDALANADNEDQDEEEETQTHPA